MRLETEAGAMQRTYSAQEIIFEQGDAGDVCYIALAGRIEIAVAGADGKTVLAQLGPGDFFGEMAVIDGNPRSARATALDDETCILAIGQAQFVYLVNQQPAFALHLLEHLSARMRPLPSTPVSRILTARDTAGAYSMVEVGEGVSMFRSRTHACNSYLFRGPRQTVLIDTGLRSTAPALLAALAEAGVQLSDIDTLVFTHEHIDHVGGSTAFPTRPRTLAHRFAAGKFEARDEFGMMCSAFSEHDVDIKVDGCLDTGDVVDTGLHALRVHHTPGHSSGSITLHDERSGIVVSGDLFMASGLLGGIFNSGSTSDSIVSLRQIAQLTPRIALPGHGPLIAEPEAAIAKAIHNCKSLIDDTRTMFGALNNASSSGRIISSFQDMNRAWLRA